ncbi:hypothetical protein Tco_1404307 [Tanacetum coccineum]
MANLKFADTHNMVAFLSKPAKSEGFEQIVDFLNANPIKYALTINPTIYISCIEQFWSTVKSKTVNGEVQLHALVDGKKIIITESIVRRDLQLEDAEGVDCLPNATIFEQLALMGSKTTAWNDFSSTMASAIICLATNQKPKKKDTQVPQSSVPSDNVADEAVYKELDDSLLRVATTASSLEVEQDSGGSPRCQETIKDTIAQTRILDLEKTKTTQPEEIVSLKRRVKKLEHKKRSRTHGIKRLYKVGLTARVESSRYEESLGEDASKQGRGIHDIDAEEDITLVNDDNKIIDVDALASEEVFVAEQSGNVVEEVVDVIDDASTNSKLKSVKPKAAKVVIQEPKQGTTTTTPTIIIPVPKPLQNKGKGIMIEEPMVEQVKPMKRLEQMRLDEELDMEDFETLWKLPWLDNGLWKEPKPVEHTCKPFNYKTECSKWPTYSWREDGYCNGGNFPGAYHIGNSLHYQDLEWYHALEDSELKDEAFRNKAIMESLISDHESSNDCWKRWKSHEIYYHNYDEGGYKNETHEEEHELCGIKTHQVPVCQIKRYKMIKYPFNDEEEYVAAKEDEYNDLTITNEEAF